MFTKAKVRCYGLPVDIILNFRELTAMGSPLVFDWRDDNEAAHFAKHGVPFDFAIGVFADGARIEVQDTRAVYDPPRFNTVGVVEGLCINVTFALRGATAVIISARRASRRERRRYGTKDLG